MDAICPLSIIIVNWNTHDLLAACLHALAAPYGMPAGTEVIVVDNASADDSVRFVREHARWVRLIVEPANGGFAAGTNRGLAEAHGEMLLLLNSDTEVQPGALTAMMAYLRAHPESGIVGADLRNSDGTPQPCAGSAPSFLSETCSILGLDRRLRILTSRRPEPPAGMFLQRDWVMGAGLMIRRAAYESVGPLDKGYFFYSEEIDWCTRVRARGWQVGMLCGARILHHGGGATHRTHDRMRTALYHSKIRYLALHRGQWSARVFRTIVRAVAGIHVVSAKIEGEQAKEEGISWLSVRQSV